MREMKGPRVWDDELGKMLYSKFEQYDDSIGFRFGEHLETENPVYMWPSGLKDKNGKEIYEGDIIGGFNPYDNQHDGVASVKFSDGAFWSSTKPQVLVDYIHDEFTLNKLEVEVIGNIYENPELLE